MSSAPTPSFPHIEQLSADILHLNPEGTNWAIFEARFQDAMETACRWSHFDGSKPRPVPKDIDNPLDTEKQEAAHWDRKDQIAWNLLNKRLPDATMLEVRRYKTAKERWDIVKLEFMAKSAYTRNALHRSFMEMRCPKGGDVRAFLTSLKTRRNELLAAGVTVNNEDFERTVLDGIPDALGTYALQLLTSTCLNGNTLAMKDIIHALSEEADRTRNRRMPKDQSQGQRGNKEGQSDEALATTSHSKGGNSRRRKGKCHHCGKEGHWVRECCTKKREEAAEAAAAGTQSGQAAQTSTSTSTSKPENRPAGSANVAYTDNTDNEEFWAAATEAAHAHADPAKPDPWTGGLDWDDNSYEVDIAPRVKSPPLRCNALHAHAPSHTPASSGAPDEEAEPL